MIYDCFSFFNELDMLELRLETLDSTVDYFVIVEAGKTHAGADKPFLFENNKERFSRFLNKIIYAKAPIPEGVYNPWAVENIQRNYIAEVVKQHAKPGDTILLSDLDEIPRPELVAQYAGSAEVVSFNVDYYCYYINSQNYYQRNWLGTTLVSYENFFSVADNLKVAYNDYMLEEYNQGTTPTKLRCASELRRCIIKNGGWHFTSLGGADAVLQKLRAFAHQEFNLEEISAEQIGALISSGKGPFIKQIHFAKPINSSFPKPIIDNPKKYSHLIFPVTEEYLKRTRVKRIIFRAWCGFYCFCEKIIPEHTKHQISKILNKLRGLQTK
jgi:beta-1,4-mannosyl-glycoprotein beta-1,4-N-acetylglucosaminyltransferase